MSEARFTPGPWGIDFGHTQRNGQVYWQVHDGHHAICCNQFCYADNTEANARLIAAAPDMYEALRKAAGVLTGDTMSKRGLVEALEAIKSALSKVEAA